MIKIQICSKSLQYSFRFGKVFPNYILKIFVNTFHCLRQVAVHRHFESLPRETQEGLHQSVVHQVQPECQIWSPAPGQIGGTSCFLAEYHRLHRPAHFGNWFEPASSALEHCCCLEVAFEQG